MVFNEISAVLVDFSCVLKFQNMLDFLDKAERRFKDLGPIASDIDSIKGQMNQLQKFKEDVDPHMVKVESLNR